MHADVMAVYMCTLRGTLASSRLNEIFIHSLAIQSNASQDTVAQTLGTQWEAILDAGLHTLLPSPVVYMEATAAAILNMEPPDPRIAAASHFVFGPHPGTDSSSMVPSQCAVAVSFKAGFRPNGTPQKGRFYLPCPGVSYIDGSNGTLVPSAALTIRDHVADFWAAMNAAGMTPSMWSRTYGTITAWDAIRVGETIDTIRRRRNELPEVYTQYVTVA